MSKDPTGGPAFPSELGVNFERGMSKREYFAAAALPCFITNQILLEAVQAGEVHLLAGAAAKAAFQIADAMIAESVKP